MATANGLHMYNNNSAIHDWHYPKQARRKSKTAESPPCSLYPNAVYLTNSV